MTRRIRQPQVVFKAGAELTQAHMKSTKVFESRER